MVLADGILAEVLPDGKSVEDVLNEVDTDHNLSISFDEFRAYLRRQEMVLKWPDGVAAGHIVVATAADIGRADAAAELRAVLDRHWLSTVADLRALSDAEWTRLGFPLKFEKMLRRELQATVASELMQARAPAQSA